MVVGLWHLRLLIILRDRLLQYTLINLLFPQWLLICLFFFCFFFFIPAKKINELSIQGWYVDPIFSDGFKPLLYCPQGNLGDIGTFVHYHFLCSHYLYWFVCGLWFDESQHIAIWVSLNLAKLNDSRMVLRLH